MKVICIKLAPVVSAITAFLNSYFANAGTADMLLAVSVIAVFVEPKARITRTADLITAVATFLMCEADVHQNRSRSSCICSFPKLKARITRTAVHIPQLQLF